jgi:hypothetical protein
MLSKNPDRGFMPGRKQKPCEMASRRFPTSTSNVAYLTARCWVGDSFSTELKCLTALKKRTP